MKTSIFAGLTLASALISATPSFALAILVESCATADGQYSVSIIDNQGISTTRTSHLQASVVAADGTVVGSYNVVNASPVVQPASFRHTTFKGQGFVFNGASTNSAASFSATLTDGTSVVENLTCN